MKKLMYYLSLAVIYSTLFAQSTQPVKERNVLWVHGLGDNANFWNRQYVNAQRDYRIRSYSFTYPTNQGISHYADRIRARSNAIRGSRTIAVGHSMGGVAIREANMDDNGLYGGMITLGAPLDGARIANAVITGQASRFVQQSTAILSRGPIASRSRNFWQKLKETIGAAFRGHTLSGVIRLFGRPIANILEDLGGRFEQEIIDNFDPKNPSVRDLAENSTYMRGIRSFQSTQPKILAWGDEDSPVHARLLASNITLDNSRARHLLSAYNVIGNGYKIAADGIKVGGFLCFSRCKGRKRREKEAWNAGADYIKRGWEIAWNQLIGARYSETYTTTQRVYVCAGNNPLQLVRFDQDDDECLSGFNNPCNVCGWASRQVTGRRWVNRPSDGLIKMSSQVGQLSSWGGKQVRLPGVNHAEMGVHSQVDKLFRDAFGSDLHGDFFETRRR